MSTTTTATATGTATASFTFTQWDEKPVAGADGGARIAHAAVTNDFTGVIKATGTSCQYTLVYTDETTGAFVGHEFIDGSVDGRSGSFVLEQRGSFGADGTISCTLTVHPGSGSGELAGLTGTGSFTTRHGASAVPYTFTYDIG
ncbi:DUF3224 domain-containing protein [Streptomyces sp. MZ04]|uniref:DUF3224 domain-containing protein n=1 Tax=Streptomyces sp. MZ04 TaxID=2559236 RepID=UPI00107EE562|nr:DUF3224 domain-containing protein [Streptomyces sp. MZ04]TGA95171.1 DUF3224 domain-containing protein [Streptomyces sp. MZ04]